MVKAKLYQHIIKLVSAAILSGCATVQVPLSSSTYRKDLSIRSGSYQILGFGVLPQAQAYHLELRSRKDPELIRVSNCHRDVVFRNEDDKFSYGYIPNRSVENGSCILQFTFLDSKGYHQFGAISFVDGETLPAVLSCNGEKYHAVGASTCQAKVGTIQVIEFEKPLQAKASTGCELPISNGKAWQYKVKEDYCLYIFKSDSNEFHKLTTFGYNEVVNQ